MHVHTIALTLTAATTTSLEEQAAVEFVCAPPPGAALELHVAGIALEPFLRPGDMRWHWHWTAPGAAGALTAVLSAHWPAAASTTQTHTLHIQPRKIDQERYQQLLVDLQALSHSLVIALSGGTAPARSTPERTTQPYLPAELIAICTGPDSDRFAAAVGRIARRPPEPSRTTITATPPGEARDLSRLDATRLELADDAIRPNQPIGAAQLRSIPEARPAPDHSPYELRLLVRTLTILTRRLADLAATPGLPPAAVSAIAQAQSRLQPLTNLPALVACTPLDHYHGPTSRLQRDPDYRIVLRMWQRLHRHPAIAWSDATLQLPIAALPLLYERWCTLATAHVLLAQAGWRITQQNLLSQEADDDPHAWVIGLPTHTPLLTLARDDGAQLTLWYQPRYQPGPLGDRIGSLDRHIRIPDLAICLQTAQAPPVLHILDAKYRLDPQGSVPESALADAYSYLGSIGVADGRRIVAGTALLYPGTGPAEHYASQVAALPLLPGTTHHLQAWLEKLTI